MCSISGYLSDRELPTCIAVEMLRKTEHRGPDAHGLYIDGEIWRSRDLGDLVGLEPARVCLGHSELWIAGAEIGLPQPYRSANGRLSLVLNGEIYNAQELEQLLEKDRIPKEQRSDSGMLLLRLLEDIYDGDLLRTVQSVVKLINGMYVLAVTDGEEIVIARDPMGIKPIYYVEKERCVYFCSEKKGLYDIDDTFKRIPPGMILQVNKAGVSLQQGVQIERPQIDVTDRDAAVTLYKNALTEAVERTLRDLGTDKVGMIFSGGVDSVLIAKLTADLGGNITCYCVGKEDSDDVQNARRVARDLGLDLRVVHIDKALVEKLLPEIIESIEMEGLLQVEVAVPMYLAALAAAEDGIKVMFTGQGADELFAGYWWYNDVVKEDGYLKLHTKMWEDIDLAYDDTLEREDKVTMAHSVELRVPYLDRNVVQCAMRISPRLKLKDSNDSIRKWIHRDVAALIGVPDYIAYRVKTMAQSGSGIHNMIQEMATAFFAGKRVDEEVAVTDKGSNYRYLDEQYGTPEMWAYIQEMRKVT
jgi:asparagine synthase (glutamine-hydrolysing)